MQDAPDPRRRKPPPHRRGPQGHPPRRPQAPRRPSPPAAGNTPALDETRSLFTSRLKALGATLDLVPGTPKADWLYDSHAKGPVPPTAICRRKKPGPISILLCGHLDTVHDPKSSFRELSIAAGGKTATGPGCVDMKGGLVIAVAALEALEEAGLPVSWGFIFNSDEETGSFHSDAALTARGRHYTYGLVLEARHARRRPGHRAPR